MGKQSRLKKERREQRNQELQEKMQPYLTDEDKLSVKDNLNRVADLAETMQMGELNKELAILLDWFRKHFDNICSITNDEIKDIVNVAIYDVEENVVKPLTTDNVAKVLLTLDRNNFPVVLNDPITESFTPDDIDGITNEDKNTELLEAITTAVFRVAECNRIMAAAQQLTLMNDMPLNLTHERIGDIRLEKGQMPYPCHEIIKMESGIILLASAATMPKVPMDFKFKL